MMPPTIACRFTMGEGAALAVIAAKVAKQGRCVLTIGHIAALAGVCRTTVRNAVRQAVGLGLIRSDEWRLSAFRSAPNTVTILSTEWLAWLRLGGRVQNRETHVYTSTSTTKIKAKQNEGDWQGRRGKGCAVHDTNPPSQMSSPCHRAHRPSLSYSRSKGSEA